MGGSGLPEAAVRAHPDELVVVLCDALVRLRVPEEDGRVGALWLRVRCNQSVAEKTPSVIGADVGKIDEGIDGERDAERAALPRQRLYPAARHLQCPQVLPVRRVELDHRHLACGANLSTTAIAASEGKYGTICCPFEVGRG
jgi:hypothetical protein